MEDKLGKGVSEQEAGLIVDSKFKLPPFNQRLRNSLADIATIWAAAGIGFAAGVGTAHLLEQNKLPEVLILAGATVAIGLTSVVMVRLFVPVNHWLKQRLGVEPHPSFL